jgi:hypothetical protein
MIKTFRGLLADPEQNRIRLSTKKGKIGYRIKKLEIITKTPGASQVEHIVKIYKVVQSSIDGSIDLADGNLLAVATYHENDNGWTAGPLNKVIMEQEVFNQDIYITGIDVNGSSSVNYYLELETTTLTDNAAAVSTLRDIRLNPQVGA